MQMSILFILCAICTIFQFLFEVYRYLKEQVEKRKQTGLKGFIVFRLK
jgi:hypothetical protein